MVKKILIIDDEKDMRIFLETLFRKGGFETKAAVNGEEALRHLEEFSPDLITLDILMPKKSGLSFFYVIKQDNRMKSIPIIVLSGVTRHNEFFNKSEFEGPVEFIEKPVEPDTLLGLARQLLGE